MTGFGDASMQAEGVHYFIEVRSLNNKYFKVVIRLPEEFQALEADLESVLRTKLTRGTITVTGSCTDSSESAAMEVNHRALERYVEQIRNAPSVSGGQVPIDLGALLHLPGVLQRPADEEERNDRARAAFRKLLDEACEHLIAMREREGHMLVDDLTAQRDMIAERLEKIAERAPHVVTEQERRLRSRIDGMLQEAGLSVEPVDLIREIATYAERTDIAEEVTRLRGHIDQFSDLLGGNDGRPVGRTLDFLAQEMLREANTIASKSPDSLISRLIVEVKGSIDRIKEQVQNVE